MEVGWVQPVPWRAKETSLVFNGSDSGTSGRVYGEHSSEVAGYAFQEHTLLTPTLDVIYRTESTNNSGALYHCLCEANLGSPWLPYALFPPAARSCDSSAVLANISPTQTILLVCSGQLYPRLSCLFFQRSQRAEHSRPEGRRSLPTNGRERDEWNIISQDG